MGGCLDIEDKERTPGQALHEAQPRARGGKARFRASFQRKDAWPRSQPQNCPRAFGRFAVLFRSSALRRGHIIVARAGVLFSKRKPQPHLQGARPLIAVGYTEARVLRLRTRWNEVATRVVG